MVITLEDSFAGKQISGEDRIKKHILKFAKTIPSDQSRHIRSTEVAQEIKGATPETIVSVFKELLIDSIDGDILPSDLYTFYVIWDSG